MFVNIVLYVVYSVLITSLNILYSAGQFIWKIVSTDIFNCLELFFVSTYAVVSVLGLKSVSEPQGAIKGLIAIVLSKD